MQSQPHNITKGTNGKEGILFSFIMSAIMIYVMAALNYGVRTGDVGTAAWSYAFFNWPLAYVIGMICDLCICTPSSRAIMNRFCAQTDRAVWKGITVKFLMVVPIVNETGAVVGFVSDSDVLRRFAQDNLPVSDISTLITGMARGEFPELSHAPHEPAEVFMGLHDDWDNIDDRLRTRTRGQDGMKHQVERIAA